MKRILCYGDSNTFGYISGTDHMRFDENSRWPQLLQKKLGNEFCVIEEGLNSRTILSNDPRPGREGRSGYEYLLPCLDSHDPLDLIIVMLGTNETKVRYNKTAAEIGEMLENYIIKPIQTRTLHNSLNPQILIITPVKINGKLANAKCNGTYDENSEIKSIELEEHFKEVAKRNNCHYLSALNLETGVDGVHLTQNGHKLLADMIYEKIGEMFVEDKKSS